MKNNTLLPGLILLLVVVATGVGIFYQTQGVIVSLFNAVSTSAG